jgi:hypothetical protein
MASIKSAGWPRPANCLEALQAPAHGAGRELPGCRLRPGHVGYRFIRSAALRLPQPQRSFAFAVPASQTILSKTITFEMKALTFRMCFNPQLLAIALKSSFK